MSPLDRATGKTPDTAPQVEGAPLHQSGEDAVERAEDIRAKSLGCFIKQAEEIADSQSVLGIYAAPEWGELDENGHSWIAGIVRETLARAAATLPIVPVPASGEVERPEADLVRRFAEALLAKLDRSEAKYGWQRAWTRADWADDLNRHLHEHIAKGDPIDVAAYCAFAWHHGWSLATLSSPPSPPSGEVGELVERLRREAIDHDALPPMYLVNPDGPEAADRLTSMSARVKELEGAATEADTLFGELLDKESSRAFWCIGGSLLSKLSTIRLTLARRLAALHPSEQERKGL